MYLFWSLFLTITITLTLLGGLCDILKYACTLTFSLRPHPNPSSDHDHDHDHDRDPNLNPDRNPEHGVLRPRLPKASLRTPQGTPTLPPALLQPVAPPEDLQGWLWVIHQRKP